MKIGLILSIVASVIFIGATFTFSQEPAEQTKPVLETGNESDMQWVWGEVVTLDAQNKTILLKYLDYETDQEKEINIKLDDKTTFENAESAEEIKPKDTLSIDYVVSDEGENIAKNISVEQPQNPQDARQASEEGQKMQEKEPAPLQEVPPVKEDEPGEAGY